MKHALPQSRFLVGLIVGIEGLAVWVVAIFLASYSATGSITWPGADMYTTSAGTMSAWVSSPGFGGYELLAYFGLLVAVAGPGWFWVGKSVMNRMQGRRTPGMAAIQGAAGRDRAGIEDEVDWIPATEIASDSNDEADSGRPSWATKVIDADQSSRPDAIEQRLASGDFFRGSGAKGRTVNADDPERENANGGDSWSFGAATDE